MSEKPSFRVEVSPLKREERGGHGVGISYGGSVRIARNWLGEIPIRVGVSTRWEMAKFKYSRDNDYVIIEPKKLDRAFRMIDRKMFEENELLKLDNSNSERIVHSSKNNSWIEEL